MPCDARSRRRRDRPITIPAIMMSSYLPSLAIISTKLTTTADTQYTITYPSHQRLSQSRRMQSRFEEVCHQHLTKVPKLRASLCQSLTYSIPPNL
jgi:hypothetical protein